MLRLKDTDEALAEAVRERLGPEAGEAAIGEVIAQARDAIAAQPAMHRALADARREQQIWLAVSRGRTG